MLRNVKHSFPGTPLTSKRTWVVEPRVTVPEAAVAALTADEAIGVAIGATVGDAEEEPAATAAAPAPAPAAIAPPAALWCFPFGIAETPDTRTQVTRTKEVKVRILNLKWIKLREFLRSSDCRIWDITQAKNLQGKCQPVAKRTDYSKRESKSDEDEND